ncbi:MAG: hypothetical protein H0W67_06795 [Gemmatimonadales bacterium]|nr:hypothetical protein [Gemmatimonadales bacterium]
MKVPDTIREARLRLEFAKLYPGLQADLWQPASQIGRQLLLYHLVTPTQPLGERVMDEAHFEFRGGGRREPATVGARTRANDEG